MTTNVAATETALYTKRGERKPRSQRFARRQLCGPRVAVRIESKSCGGGSTCPRGRGGARRGGKPATRGGQRPHAFTWRARAACFAGLRNPTEKIHHPPFACFLI